MSHHDRCPVCRRGAECDCVDEPEPTPTGCTHRGPPFVSCATCHRIKAPWGRSAPAEMACCDWGCPGYDQPPRPSQLWPGERCMENYVIDWGHPKHEARPA